MLDIKFIRENKNIVQEGAKRKHINVEIEKLIALDDERLKQLKEIEELRTEVNKVSNNISRNCTEEAILNSSFASCQIFFSSLPSSLFT